MPIASIIIGMKILNGNKNINNTTRLKVIHLKVMAKTNITKLLQRSEKNAPAEKQR